MKLFLVRTACAALAITALGASQATAQLTMAQAQAAVDAAEVEARDNGWNLTFYVTDAEGRDKLIYMDEVGTPDSSRIWDGPSYREGRVVENSKEEFRQKLLNYFPDPDILTNKDRMDERPALAEQGLPEHILMETSATYSDIAEKITGEPLRVPDNPRAEIVQILSDTFGLID